VALICKPIIEYKLNAAQNVCWLHIAAVFDGCT